MDDQGLDAISIVRPDFRSRAADAISEFERALRDFTDPKEVERLRDASDALLRIVVRVLIEVSDDI